MDYNKNQKTFKPNSKIEQYLKYAIASLLIVVIFLNLILNFFNNKVDKVYEDSFYLDEYETNVYNNIKEKLLNSKCSFMG